MPVDQAAIMSQVFNGATALAGLLLVFLGNILAGFERYEAEERGSVRDKFKRRAHVSFTGFLAALISAALALLFNWCPTDCLFVESLVALTVSFGSVIVAGWISIKDIG